MEATTTKTIKGEIYRVTLKRELDETSCDVVIEIGHLTARKVLVAGMYGAGGLDLSEHSPAGEKVSLSDDLFEELAEIAEELGAQIDDEEEETRAEEDEDGEGDL